MNSPSELRQRRTASSTKKKKKKTLGVASVTPPSSSSASSRDLDGFAWLAVFLPALAYYVLALNRGGGRSLAYPVAARSLVCGSYEAEDGALASSCEDAAAIFPAAASESLDDEAETFELRYPLEEILANDDDDHGYDDDNDDDDDGARRRRSGRGLLSGPSPDLFRGLNDLLWVHDDDLGRGYLLVSDAVGNRVWRWEVGGGPITIGRTLHMERSGCRSNAATNCAAGGRVGSAGLTVTTTALGSGTAKRRRRDDDPSSSAAEVGRLIVSELGERRVVRVEEDGARTPLVRGVANAWDVLYVPTLRDLLYASSDEKEAESGRPTTLRALRRIDRIPPLPAAESRAAHFATDEDDGENDERTIDVVYRVANEGDSVSGPALARDYRSVYVLERRAETDELLIVNVALEEPDDDDEEEDEEDEDDDEVRPCANSVFYNLTDHVLAARRADASTAASPPPLAGGLATDAEGHVYAAVPEVGVVVVDADGDHLATIPVRSTRNDDVVADVGFGEDGFLYVATSRRLLRIRTPNKGMTMGRLNEGAGYDGVRRIRCGSDVL